MSSTRRAFAFAAAALAALASLPAWGLLPEPAALPDFDVRAGARAQPADATLLGLLPAGTSAHLHPALGRLHMLTAWGQPLSPASAARPDAIARAFVATHGALLGLDQRQLEALALEAVIPDRASGGNHVWLTLAVDGVPVFHGRIGVHLDAGGRVIALGAGDLGPARPSSLVPALDAGTALAIALDEAVSGPSASLAADPTLSVFLARSGPRLAWQIETDGLAAARYVVLIDAVDGSLLWRTNLTRYAQGLAYRLSPEAETARTLYPFDATAASPAGWVDAGVEATRGNNVTAEWDPGRNLFVICLDGTSTPVRPPAASRDFSYPLDLALEPETYTDASITNLFYLNNVIHDYLYELGFDEVSGNFQNDTFGLGGLGADAVLAQAQDGWPACRSTLLPSVNNANFTPSVDGVPGKMQMYVWTLSMPFRDGSLDSDIVFHEYGHGLSTRLVGGPACSTCLGGAQGGAMGEGWGDYFALALNGDDALAEYSANDPDGIRRYRYGSSPLRFGDLGNDGCEVHNDGEIWATVLWQLRGDYSALYGATGGHMFDRNVVDAMKLSPPDPDFLAMRDALIAAAVANGEEPCVVWQIFANRGMGTDALPGSDCSVTEGFAVLAGCECALPAPVTGLAAATVPGGVGLDWDSSSGAAGYVISRSSDGCAGPFAAIGSAREPATEFVDPTATDPLVYGYIVRAFSPFGTLCSGADSACVPFDRSGCSGSAPSVLPNSLRAVKDDDAVRLAWATSGSGLFNIHDTLLASELTSLWSLPATLAVPGVPLTTVTYAPVVGPSEVRHIQVFGADGCTGSSVP